MMVYKSQNILLLIISLCFVACSQFSSKKLPDISNISEKVEINNFSDAIYKIDTLQIAASNQKLLSDYPEFYPFFTNDLMEWTDPQQIQNELKSFITHPDIRSVFDTVSHKFSDLETINSDLVTAFKYYKHYYPDGPLPEIVYFVSAFRQMVLTLGEDVLGIGLDMHLGKDCNFYRSAGYSEYMIKQFTKDHIAAHAMEVWAQQLHGDPIAVSRFIDEMIYRGKMLYFLDLVLPELSDHLKIGYNEEDIQWCKNNEKEVWEFFVEKKLLFENESAKFKYYVNDGPHSMGMPKKAPGKIGRWVGWQIVRKFMKENPEVSIQELFAMTDGAKILKKSKYKPQ